MGSGEAKRFRDLYSSAGRHGDSFWREEKDNVGMKLLRSMGWETGMGLGKDGSGRTTVVKQFRKKDNAGIGSTAGTRDEAYRASQDLFNDILSRLSGGDSAPQSSPQLGSNANTVSGMVAKRQLVRRFVRGGTDKSSSDMAAILGQRASVTPALSSQSTEELEDSSRAEEGQHTSTVSLHDYFARKRRELGLQTTDHRSVAGARGFTLEDQTMFAESQVRMAYEGRRGLGMVNGAINPHLAREGECFSQACALCARRARVPSLGFALPQGHAEEDDEPKPEVWSKSASLVAKSPLFAPPPALASMSDQTSSQGGNKDSRGEKKSTKRTRVTEEKVKARDEEVKEKVEEKKGKKQKKEKKLKERDEEVKEKVEEKSSKKQKKEKKKKARDEQVKERDEQVKAKVEEKKAKNQMEEKVNEKVVEVKKSKKQTEKGEAQDREVNEKVNVKQGKKQKEERVKEPDEEVKEKGKEKKGKKQKEERVKERNEEETGVEGQSREKKSRKKKDGK